jgi:hypothetical protein
MPFANVPWPMSILFWGVLCLLNLILSVFCVWLQFSVFYVSCSCSHRPFTLPGNNLLYLRSRTSIKNQTFYPSTASHNHSTYLSRQSSPIRQCLVCPQRNQGKNYEVLALGSPPRLRSSRLQTNEPAVPHHPSPPFGP